MAGRGRAGPQHLRARRQVRGAAERFSRAVLEGSSRERFSRAVLGSGSRERFSGAVFGSGSRERFFGAVLRRAHSGTLIRECSQERLASGLLMGRVGGMRTRRRALAWLLALGASVQACYVSSSLLESLGLAPFVLFDRFATNAACKSLQLASFRRNVLTEVDVKC